MIPRSRKLTLEFDKPLLVLIIISLLIRVVFFLFYRPASFDDTLGYIDTGQTLQAANFEGYNASRTPVYPLLMVATGFDPWRLWMVQLLMGLAITVMLYLLARFHTGNSRIAFVVGLSYSLALNSLFFEAALLTETAGTFLLFLSLIFFILTRRRKGRLIFYVATAILASLAALTRPLMLLLAPLYLLFFIRRWHRRDYDRRLWVRYLAGFGLPVAILLGGYIIFNGNYAGSFTFSTLTGYNLAGHSGAFIEYAPDEYATIRDIYLKYREARVAATGTHIWTIWDAQGEMSQATGLDFVGLNNALTRLSVRLIATHPLMYLRNVAVAWAQFWASGISWDLDNLASADNQTIFNGLWWVVRGVLIFINVTFLFIGLHSLYERRRKYRVLNYDPEFHWLVLTLVLGTALLQALIIFADNWRLSAPYQPLIVYVVIVWLWLFGLRWQRRRARTRSGEEADQVKPEDMEGQGVEGEDLQERVGASE
jgi:4-amino-4-deoxy-L-arabinose transferase-like glycosyltransferase